MGVSLCCGRGDDPAEFLRQETAELQRRTVPPGSGVLARSGPIFDGFRAVSRWEFETDWDWSKYKEWVTPNLAPRLGAPRINDSRLVFVRSREGDAEELEIAVGAKASRLRVRVNLATYPD